MKRTTMTQTGGRWSSIWAKGVAKVAVVVAMVAASAAVSCKREGGSEKAMAEGSKAPLRIAVVPKGTTHDFWKSVEAGALAAGKEVEGVNVTFRGPEKEDDREQQIALMQNLISSKVDGIVLAPLDSKALVGPVMQAKAAGIPVVIIDSALEAKAGTDFAAFVATDNYQGGMMGGARLAEVMGGKGSVLLLRYLEGSASTREREQGFLDAVAKVPGIRVIDPGRFGGPTRATAQEAAEALLAANPDVGGVFCCNEPTTFGMLLALKSRAGSEGIRFVGFDASDAAVEGLTNGRVQGLVLQNPYRMGEAGVQAVLDTIAGRPVEASIDTGVLMITPENIGEAASRAALGALAPKESGAAPK
ncbi:MAG: substrate-binding domain-containing protein [bacterium]|nr:substrate-binding domain-containing protein [bacterium]